MHRSRIGLISLISIVISSQLGVGIFMLPSRFAPYGTIGLFGWAVAGLGAVLLGLTFSELFRRVPKTGGPYAYVREAFGDTAAFFTGWTHWLVSVVSNVPLVLSGIEYISCTFGVSCSEALWQVSLLSCLTFINLLGGRFVARTETVLSVVKLALIAAIPFAGLFSFEISHFANFNPSGGSWLRVVGTTSLMSMWCFIGLESATIPGGIVEDASRTVPRATIIGIVSVLLIYISNIVGIMAIVPPEVLSNSQAPYAEASKLIFGGAYYAKLIPAAAALVCIGCLNAWIFSGGFISRGLASDGLLPKQFLAENRFGAPYMGLIVSYLFTLIFLSMCLRQGFKEGMAFIIDASVATYLVVYASCALSLVVLLFRSRQIASWKFVFSFSGLLFAIWVTLSAGLVPLAVVLCFLLSGLPVYLYMRVRKVGAWALR